MWENEVLGGPDYPMNIMTSRETNRCRTVVGDVYNALCCDVICSNHTVVLVRQQCDFLFYKLAPTMR